MYEMIKEFADWLKGYMEKGDMIIVGLDMKKDPLIIQTAYSNEKGVNRKFNMNLLSRINKELDGNFDLSQFYHHCYFNPSEGAITSVIVSNCHQTVTIKGKEFVFGEYEVVFIGRSRKFSQKETEELIINPLGMKTVKHFDDSNSYFRENVCLKE